LAGWLRKLSFGWDCEQACESVKEVAPQKIFGLRPISASFLNFAHRFLAALALAYDYFWSYGNRSFDIVTRCLHLKEELAAAVMEWEFTIGLRN
jgi:hypothetical protein